MKEIRVIKIQKARKMKYNNAEGVTIMKHPKTEKKPRMQQLAWNHTHTYI